MLLLFWTWLMGMIVCMNGLEVASLSDGIIVSNGENISIIEGEWTLLLTIHESGVRHRLEAHTELVGRGHE